MKTKKNEAVTKEILALEKKEEKLKKAALNAEPPKWKTELESKIPPKVYIGLESAFAKGFSLVFQQGRALIERSYNKKDIQENHSIRDYAVQVKGGRRELRRLRRGAGQSDLLNLTVTTVEGMALGVLGIGMPDILLFLSTLLRGIYETALNYGFSYETKQDQFLILKMMETSLCTGEKWAVLNEEVNRLMGDDGEVTEELFNAQLQKTASAFAMDMLLLKFIQGLPVVGIVGGAANPVYYNKVMRYIQLKYNKRYLLQLCTVPVISTEHK